MDWEGLHGLSGANLWQKEGQKKESFNFYCRQHLRMSRSDCVLIAWLQLGHWAENRGLMDGGNHHKHCRMCLYKVSSKLSSSSIAGLSAQTDIYRWPVGGSKTPLLPEIQKKKKRKRRERRERRKRKRKGRRRRRGGTWVWRHRTVSSTEVCKQSRA